MAEKIIGLSDDFWNIRGDMRIGKVLNIGTQCSLVRLAEGRFVFLDSYTLKGDIRDRVMALTDGGRMVEAVLNLHPFHTLHCARMAADFPGATFYGSARHWREVPQIAWASDPVESPAVAARFPQLAFSLPDGIAYISEDEAVHAGSLLAFHPPSGTLHVDDTINVLPLPEAVRKVLPVPRIAFHPTVRKALDDDRQAGARFCDWAERIAADWSATRTLCAAHSALARFEEGGFSDALRAAARKARPRLTAARR
ncbi:hypothetical protein OCGS_2821 [Oceaniovalibus guishaninsula JLT2003]|uniref:Metallo-beta-lactamase domain-containing protein n=1 Tax=Oceaniovalibus guishaninsula JLT2003 TaxID=1231392 RepID=K2I2Y9_9RHOB|nr:hypothetical protein [Oceaniovalibus guishaninsula]EKE43230.1 hypothetical protein OCGS_2821 [Oceaniovalibus guishaninsula JLT2003]